nr:DUF4134 domain-containing protein [Sunxiuqinia indica]
MAIPSTVSPGPVIPKCQKYWSKSSFNKNPLNDLKVKKYIQRFFFRVTAITATLFLGAYRAMAQSSAGIDQATAEVSSYVDPVSNLIIAIGAVVGLIGGVRVYIKWQSGDQDTQKAIMGWFGACLFLILVGVVIKAFFV